MFEINGTAYKVFEEGMVSAPKDQINELMVLDSEKLQSISANAKFMYLPFPTEPLTKGFSESGWATSGKERMHVKLTTLNAPLQWVTQRSVKAKWEAHRKSWGVWWRVKRTVDYHFRIAYKFNGDNKGTARVGRKGEMYAHEYEYKDNWTDPVQILSYYIQAENDQAGQAAISSPGWVDLGDWIYIY